MATPDTPRQPPMTPADQSFIPPAVAAAAARASEIQAQLNGGNPPPVTPPGNPPPEPPPAPSPAPSPAPPPSEPTDAEIEAYLAQPSEPGSELARMQHALRSQIGRTKALKRQLDNAGRTVAPPVVAPLLQPVTDVPDLELPAEAVEVYGADLINIMSQVANHAAAKTRAAVLKEVAPALQSVATTTIQQLQDNARNVVSQALAPWGRDFASVDEDPNFITWLKLTDRMSGVTRNELFLRAWHAGNADSLTAIMTTYLSEVAAAPQPTPTTPVGAPPAPTGRTVVPLETFAAPGRAPNPTPPPSTQGVSKEVYTASAVKNFYEKKRRGEFVGHEAEVAETERLIAEASREGRIIQGA